MYLAGFCLSLLSAKLQIIFFIAAASRAFFRLGLMFSCCFAPFFPHRGRGRWYKSCRLFCHSFVPRYCQTGRFAFPNGPFQVLKRAVSDCKTARFVTRWLSMFCAASFALLSFAPFPLAPAAGIVPVNGAAVSLRLGPYQSPAPCASSGDRPICWCQWA